MAQIDVSITPTFLMDWPDDQLQRVWRLSTSAIRALGVTDDTSGREQIEHLEVQAAAVGAELVRRRLI